MSGSPTALASRSDAPLAAKSQKSSAANPAQRRSPAQVRSMTHDIVTLYVTLLSQFFAAPTAAALAQDANDPNATPPMPDWVPLSSNATTNSHWLIRVLNEIVDCGAELGALELSGEATQTLKDVVMHARSCFESAVCSGWIRGESHPLPINLSRQLMLLRACRCQGFLPAGELATRSGSAFDDRPPPTHGSLPALHVDLGLPYRRRLGRAGQQSLQRVLVLRRCWRRGEKSCSTRGRPAETSREKDQGRLP